LRSYGGLKSQDFGKSRKIFGKNDFFAFFENNPIRENIQNSIHTVFIATPIDVLCSNFVKFSRRKVGKIVRCLGI